MTYQERWRFFSFILKFDSELFKTTFLLLVINFSYLSLPWKQDIWVKGQQFPWVSSVRITKGLNTDLYVQLKNFGGPLLGNNTLWNPIATGASTKNKSTNRKDGRLGQEIQVAMTYTLAEVSESHGGNRGWEWHLVLETRGHPGKLYLGEPSVAPLLFPLARHGSSHLA